MMPKVILLNENGKTQSLRLARIPFVGEYIFHDEQTLCAERVVLLSKLFGIKALVSVQIIDTI